MPGDVHHVVHPAHDVNVAVSVPIAAVAGEVMAGIAAEIGIEEAAVVFPQSREAARGQGRAHGDVALFAGAEFGAVFAQDA